MSALGESDSAEETHEESSDKRNAPTSDDKSASNDDVVRYKQCMKHKMDMILYCKHEGCETEICPLCMSEHHRNHSVVNVHEVQNQSFLDDLLQVVTSQRDVIMAVKQGEENAFDCMMDRLKKKRYEITKQFEAILQPIDEHIKLIEGMKNKTEANQMFENGLKAMVENLREPKTYKVYETTVTEKHKSVRLKISLAHLTISRHVKKGELSDWTTSPSEMLVLAVVDHVCYYSQW